MPWTAIGRPSPHPRCDWSSVGTLQPYSFGVFVRPLTGGFGWSRTGTSGVAGTVASVMPASGGGVQASLVTAIRTRPSAMMCIVFALLGLIGIGTLAHLVPTAADGGLSPAVAGRIAGSTGLAAVAGRGGSRVVLDGVRAPYRLAILALVAVAAFMMLAFTADAWSGWADAGLAGPAIGAEVDVTSLLVRRYFGQVLFGPLYGIMFGPFVPGGGAGPLLLGSASIGRPATWPAGGFIGLVRRGGRSPSCYAAPRRPNGTLSTRLPRDGLSHPFDIAASVIG